MLMSHSLVEYALIEYQRDPEFREFCEAELNQFYQQAGKVRPMGLSACLSEPSAIGEGSLALEILEKFWPPEDVYQYNRAYELYGRRRRAA